MKSAIRILSAVLLALMVFATLAPCISAEVQTTSAETTLNKSTTTKTTRVWSSDDTEAGRAKKAQNDSLLNDKLLYNNALLLSLGLCFGFDYFQFANCPFGVYTVNFY